MFSDLLLPPGFTVTITLGATPPLNAVVTVFEGGLWRGETPSSAADLDKAGELQAIVDRITRRGVRA